ncbi:MAG: hypothetical protein PWQ29_996 [Verrucomicrobiota bacterium]|nr:hypothetical protein [Verrucomicrobiota bacterium]
MKKQIFYTVAGVFALFSMAHAQEPLDAANMKKARGAARASVLEMKNSKEFKEARAAQKAYWDAMKEISKKGQHPPPLSIKGRSAKTTARQNRA